ncbi:DNA repair protein RadC [Jinshanibacter sp. LJY008]|uniref:DNA repair protein RadC n=1 Tax=Limnobaculum eriocheiris TaxID=2897391 RepID=A0A9X1SK22_9GAMM|nr:DNA repair protein RadC [Limnobaculum eriocheiris]MCD1125195.1 DNA repair protein RadC [Limnobaculum eriocheiris]
MSNHIRREQRIISMALQLLEKQIKVRPYSFTSSTQTREYLRLQLEQLEREVFMVLYLDNQHRLISSDVTALGTINETSIYPREIIKGSLEFNAAAVILAHNHPSGLAEPSQADRSITNKLKEALSLVDVKVLDHFVIGHGELVSFAERGWL